MTFGQFVKVFMTDAGMNQKQLAEKIGDRTERANLEIELCGTLSNKLIIVIKRKIRRIKLI